MTIPADEALLWLRDYQRRTAELGLEAVNNSFEIARIIWDIHAAGGWEKLKADGMAVHDSWRSRLQQMQERQEWLRKELQKRVQADGM